MAGKPNSRPAVTLLVSLAGLFVVWFVAAHLIGSRIFPPPGQVFAFVAKETVSGELPFHLSMTLMRVVGAFAVAMAIGSAIGIALGQSARLDRFFDPWVILFINIPALVTVVLDYIWFGL